MNEASSLETLLTQTSSSHEALLDSPPFLRSSSHLEPLGLSSHVLPLQPVICEGSGPDAKGAQKADEIKLPNR